MLYANFLVTQKIVGGLPPEPEEVRLLGVSVVEFRCGKMYTLKTIVCEQKEPEPKPGRKWEVVDASYYGGGGIGGIKPVTVSTPSVHVRNAFHMRFCIPCANISLCFTYHFCLYIEV